MGDMVPNSILKLGRTFALMLAIVTWDVRGVSASALAPLSEVEISSQLWAIYKSEAQAAEEGVKFASDKELKVWATRLGDSHTAQAKRLVGWLKASKTELITTAQSEVIAETVNTELLLLQKADRDFDKEFLAFQIAALEERLKFIDREALPGLRQPQLKRLVKKTRGDLNRQLKSAKKIQARLIL